TGRSRPSSSTSPRRTAPCSPAPTTSASSGSARGTGTARRHGRSTASASPSSTPPRPTSLPSGCRSGRCEGVAVARRRPCLARDPPPVHARRYEPRAGRLRGGRVGGEAEAEGRVPREESGRLGRGGGVDREGAGAEEDGASGHGGGVEAEPVGRLTGDHGGGLGREGARRGVCH